MIVYLLWYTIYILFIFYWLISLQDTPATIYKYINMCVCVKIHTFCKHFFIVSCFHSFFMDLIISCDLWFPIAWSTCSYFELYLWRPTRSARRRLRPCSARPGTRPWRPTTGTRRPREHPQHICYEKINKLLLPLCPVLKFTSRKNLVLCIMFCIRKYCFGAKKSTRSLTIYILLLFFSEV